MIIHQSTWLVTLLLAITQTQGDSITEQTKLVSTFLVHRHGDRTPIESKIKYSTNLEALKKASAKYGYGQLTKLGKQRSYKLGKYIRSRYDELLSDQYNSSEIYIRSTDTTRTEMTVLLAMAAVYPAYPGSWSEEINWVPTPYTTVSKKYDFNTANLNCPVFISAYQSVMMSPDSNRMSGYFEVLNVLSEQLGFNVTSIPNKAYIFFEILTNQANLGIPLGDKIDAILPGLKAASDEAMDIVFGNDDYIAYQAGPLLNEFFTYADMQIAGNDTPRVRIYSAHDVNVYAFMAVARITPRQERPKYNAAFSLELRQVKHTGEYVVLPVYQPAPGEDLVYLGVAGCHSLLCPYDVFKEIVSPYIMDEDTWRIKCGVTDDFIINKVTVAK